MCGPAQYFPLVKACEDAGFEFFYVPDSICYPAESSTEYPYNGTGEREFLAEAPFIEPFSLIPALGAVTERIKFATFVVKLPIREPVLIAKQAASTAVITNNRFTFGVGLSPWPEDFIVSNQDWKTRGKRMDEMIEIIRGLTRTAVPEFFEYKSDHYDIPRIRINPIPSEPIPIHIGGTADPALRRAARIGDGWMYAGMEGDHMRDCIAKLTAYLKEYGRANEPFEIHAPPLLGLQPDAFKQMEDLGVTHVILGTRNAYEKDEQPLQTKLDMIKGMGDGIVAQLSS
jgi:probable F420-dependent oxidoreductase